MTTVWGASSSPIPPCGDPLEFGALWPTIYQQYDLRFVYRVEDRLLRPSVLRAGWDDDSPALQDWTVPEYAPRWRDAQAEHDDAP